MRNKETIIMNQIQVALSEANCLCIRMQSGIFYSKDGQAVRIGFPGLPDLLVVNPQGEVAFLEVKPDHKAYKRPEQIKFIEQMKKKKKKEGGVTTEEQALNLAIK